MVRPIALPIPLAAVLVGALPDIEPSLLRAPDSRAWASGEGGAADGSASPGGGHPGRLPAGAVDPAGRTDTLESGTPGGGAGSAGSDPPPLLRGPSASERGKPRSIVQRNFEGRLEALEGEPEVAALRALDLTPGQRERLDAIVSRRIQLFDDLVQRHALELQVAFAALQGLETMESGAQRWKALHEVAGAWEAFAPWRARGTAIDEMADAITPQQRRDAQRLVSAWRSALLTERAADLGLPPRSPQVQAHVRLETFGRLLEESFERLSRAGEEALEDLVRSLGLSPEQGERARAIFGRLYEMEVARQATNWDRFKAISEFMRELTPAQRVRAWRHLRRQGE